MGRIKDEMETRGMKRREIWAGLGRRRDGVNREEREGNMYG